MKLHFEKLNKAEQQRLEPAAKAFGVPIPTWRSFLPHQTVRDVPIDRTHMTESVTLEVLRICVAHDPWAPYGKRILTEQLEKILGRRD